MSSSCMACFSIDTEDISGLTVRLKSALCYPFPLTEHILHHPSLHVYAQAAQTYQRCTEYATLLPHTQTHISLGEDHGRVFGCTTDSKSASRPPLQP